MNNIKIFNIQGQEVLNFEVIFFDNEISRTIKNSLPLTSKVDKWGDEIYFETDIDVPEGNCTLDVDAGSLSYWPQGKCLCLFYGPTPLSEGEKPIPASPVINVGEFKTKPKELKKVVRRSKVILK